MAPEKTNPVQAPPGRSLVITRVFDAPRRLVFEAWTQKEHLVRWSCPHGFNMTESHGDLRPGGEWGFIMFAPDGEKHEASGRYREIIPHEKLVFTHGWMEDDGTRGHETLVTVRFQDEGERTKMTFEQAIFKSVESRDGHQGGWSQCFEKLAGLLDQRKGKTPVSTEQAHSAADTSDREILLTRDFDAPRALVWEAMTDPQHVVKWWGPRGFTTTIEVMNVRPGGTWKLVMHGPDGTDYPNKSVFTEVVKPERIVYVHGGRKKGGPAAQFVATWTFDAFAPGKTRVTMRMVFPSATARDTVVREYGAIEGGKQTLARLGEELAEWMKKRL